ncbi:MAG: DUF2851 family protein [Flavobacteriaceae bacterium]|nr:DUF2851 family protein [Flavobacteriaceae bacterium]
MQEAFLHYLWKHKKLWKDTLVSTQGLPITILNVGQHNHNSGPDFFNAHIRIGEQLWAGTVEIHVNSSDWYLHNHETDVAYDNVILHVVWEEDVEVFRANNTVIPTLEIQHKVSQELLEYYQNLFAQKSRWINCETDISTIDEFLKKNWLERLYFERLERKSKVIENLLVTSKNDWEAVLFKMLAKNFGLKVNGDAFLSIANSFEFSLLRKQQTSLLGIEALLLGQAKLLEIALEQGYYITLQNEYKFLKQKFKLSDKGIIKPSFFRLRPSNFPTVRLAQLAKLYFKEAHLFSKLINANTIDEISQLFEIELHAFWNTHYSFAKESRAKVKRLTPTFINLIIINTIVPLKYSYAKYSKTIIYDTLLDLMSKLKSEKNSIVSKFADLQLVSNSAIDSQGLIQLKTEYCEKNKCLQCAIGSALLNRNM